MSKLPTYKLGKQWLSKQEYNVTIFIDDNQYLLPTPVASIWSDRILASKDIAFAKGDRIVKIRGNFYRVFSKVAKPLKTKKGEFIKKRGFHESPTAWLVFPDTELYNDPKTRTNDEL